jgi:SOS-response transcriptional repressor LexA
MKSGFPTPAEENLLDGVTLDSYLIGNRDASFMMKVIGNAMKEQGILDGDYVIVERAAEPKNGTIVITEINGEWGMKVFDSAHPISVTAVVRSVVRKYA